MRLRDRAALFAHVFYAICVIFAVLVVAIVLAALLPLEISNVSQGAGYVGLQGLWRDLRLGDSLSSTRGSGHADSNVVKINAEFGYPNRSVGKHVLINSSSPNKDTFLPVDGVSPLITRHGTPSARTIFWPKHDFGFLWGKGKSIVIRDRWEKQIRVCLDYHLSYGSIPTVLQRHNYFSDLPRGICGGYGSKLLSSVCLYKRYESSLSAYRDAIVSLTNFGQDEGKHSKQPSEDYKPKSRPLEYIPDFLTHIETAFLLVAAVCAFFGFVFVIRHGFEVRDLRFLLLAPVFAYLWYCAVSQIHL
jgi:hypothetical protein